MDYYQGVVEEYIRANRATFVNPEFLLALNSDSGAAAKGEHWYVDVLALNMKERTAYLCEVSYSVHLSAMRRRLVLWAANWTAICDALRRDAGIGPEWVIRPWLFAPGRAIEQYLVPKLPPMPVTPKITPLEMTAPWLYCTWDRPMEAEKPAAIPQDMR